MTHVSWIFKGSIAYALLQSLQIFMKESLIFEEHLGRGAIGVVANEG